MSLFGVDPVKPEVGQESVWDYPRPPACEPMSKRIVVTFGGRTLCDTTSAYRVLETSHPPVYYLPRHDCDESMLRPADGSSFCEWKGMAQYLDVVSAGESGIEQVAPKAAWTYPTPSPRFEAIANFIALYPAAMEQCTVDGVSVEPQPGGFYGGWITPDVVGPFKGGPGTTGW